MKLNILILTLTFCLAANSQVISNESPITFTAGDQQTAAYKGVFQVTENRHRQDSRSIPLHYVRFPSTSKNPGPPIIYLAGGPGGSGIATAKHYRYELFMAMREVADVIAFDQRGTGDSDSLPECHSTQYIPTDRPINDAEFIALNQSALAECFEFWKTNKIDYAAYNTLENAADLDDLRVHLGAEKISLWGISYGSHLALTAMKTMEDKLHKVIIASAEGLSQTIKYPARTDAYFERLQTAFNAAAEKPELIPDITKLMNKVHNDLDENPKAIKWENDSGKEITYYIQARDMKQLASGMISDPSRAQRMLMLYQAINAGITAPMIDIVKQHLNPEDPISFKLMGVVMDMASGISPERRQVIHEQAQSAVLSTYLNFTLHYTDLALKLKLDLGETFRTKPTSSVPTLLLSGTLDGRTYIESQREAVSGLTQVSKVKVVNAGHNLFKSSPKVIQTMLNFMHDQPLKQHTIVVNLP